MANQTYAVFDTTEGRFKAKLFADEAPKTVQNSSISPKARKPASRFTTASIFTA